MVETDHFNHIMEIDTVKLVVEIESFGMNSEKQFCTIDSSPQLLEINADPPVVGLVRALWGVLAWGCMHGKFFVMYLLGWYNVNMDDPNITLEEYIRIHAEKSQRRDFETEFPTIVYSDALTSNENVSSEPTVSIYDAIKTDLDFSISISDTEMGLDEADTLCFQLGGARRRMNWRQFILTLGLHTADEMVEDGFEACSLGSTRAIPDKGDHSDYWVKISSDRDFLGHAPSYTYIRDHVMRLCHRLISYNISSKGQAPEKVTSIDLFYLMSMKQGTANAHLLGQYLFRHAKRRKSGARLFGGYLIGRLTTHFGLVSDKRLIELTDIAREPPLINIDELVKINICVWLGDTWAWVAPGPER
ncbi:hypothetical protein Tco_0364423 [Tanacetum coccineum]